jgi:hypothetical protein
MLIVECRRSRDTDWIFIKESEKLSHNGLGLVLGDIVATGVDLYDTHV